MFRSLYSHLLLLRCPFYNMAQITDRQLNRKINRRERQREQNPPAGSTRHKPESPGGD